MYQITKRLKIGAPAPETEHTFTVESELSKEELLKTLNTNPDVWEYTIHDVQA